MAQRTRGRRLLNVKLGVALLTIITSLLFIFAAPGVALAGSSDINLTWDLVYGWGFEPSTDVTVTVEDSLGSLKGKATAKTNEGGFYAIWSEDFARQSGHPVNIKNGDRVTITVGTKTDTIIPNLSAFTSATLNKVFIESKPSTNVHITDKNKITKAETTGPDGKLEFQFDHDVLPYDYVSVYYTVGDNYVTVDPIAPYAVVSITDDAVGGFYYQPDTTATVEIYLGTSKIASAEVKTDADGHFWVESFTPEVDIKNGYDVKIIAGHEVNKFKANLEAEVDFVKGEISGKTEPGSYIIAHVEPSDGSSNYIEATATATSAGQFTVNTTLNLEDLIWVTAVHPNGNITELEIIYGTKNQALGQPVVYADKSDQNAADIKVQEIRPQSLDSTESANEITLKILTDGVTFASQPEAIPLGVKIDDFNAVVSEDSRTVTWYVTEPSTNMAGSITLKNIRYDVDTGTAVGPIKVEVGGNSGVTQEVLSNATIKTQDSKNTFTQTIKILDVDTNYGLKDARVKLLKGDGVYMKAKTTDAGECTFSVPADNYNLLISRIGYETIRVPIGVIEDATQTFKLKKTDVGVLIPEGEGEAAFEQIETILLGLGHKVSVVSEEDLANAQALKNNLKSLFINSSTLVFDTAKISAIKDFVKSGGSLYASDMSYSLVEQAFQGKVTFDSYPWVITNQVVKGDVKDKGLADYLNPSAPQYNLDLDFNGLFVPWVAIDKVSSEVDVYVSADITTGGENSRLLEDKPLAVAFDEGKGRVVFTSYYFSPWDGAVSEQGRKLIDYLVLNTLVGQEINSIKSKLKVDGYTLEKLNVGLFGSAENSAIYGFDVGPEKDLIVAAGWRHGSFKLNAQKPDGTLMTQIANTSPVYFVAGNAPEGFWKYWISKSNVSGIYPYVTAVATKPFKPADEGDGDSPGDGGPGGDTGGSPGNDGSGGSGGSGGGGGGGAAPQEPTKLSNLKVELKEGYINLSWNPLPENDAAGYNVYRTNGQNGTPVKVNEAVVKTNSFTDDTAEPDKIYYYWVTIVGKDGKEGERSAIVSASIVVVLPDVGFSDMPSGAWYKDYVVKLIMAKIINGYNDGTFRPQNNITRAEFSKMVLSAIGEGPGPSPASSFTDTSSHWAKGYIEKAKSLGLIDGYKDGSFRPDSFITRAEICKIISLAKGLDISSASSGFNDCNDHWAEKYIAATKASGVVSGYNDGTFRPSSFATRAEVAKMVCVMIEG